MLPLVVLCLVLAQRLARRLPDWEVLAAPAAWTQHGTAALAALWALAAQPEAIDLRLSGSWSLPLTFAGLAAIYALDCRLTGRWQRLWIVALAATPAFLTASDALDLPPVASAVLLVALAWVYALAAGRVPGARATSGLRLVAGAQALLAAPLAPQDAVGALVLLAATALGVFLARDTGAPAWLYLAGVVGTLDWFWWARALLPEPTRATSATFFAVYSPLPVVIAGAAVLAGRMAGRRWAWPLVAVAGFDALWITVGALAVEDWWLLGTLLLVYGAAVYGVAAILRRPLGVAAALMLAAGAVSLLYAADAPAAAYPPVVAAVAVAVYGAGRLWAWRAGREDAWTQAHGPAALGLAGVTALACLLVPPFYRTGAAGALGALAAWWVAALLLAVDGRRRRSAGATYGAGAIAVLGALWLVRYAGLVNPQCYAVPPGVWLVWAGAVVRGDRRLRAPATTARLLAGSGAAVLLGTSAIQSFAGGSAGAVYTTVLVLEGIAALLAGIALRHRVLVVAGGAGLALGALRAVFPLLQTLPLFVVFGLAAVVLLAVAAGLAALRDRWRASGGPSGGPTVDHRWIHWSARRPPGAAGRRPPGHPAPWFPGRPADRPTGRPGGQGRRATAAVWRALSRSRAAVRASRRTTAGAPQPAQSLVGSWRPSVRSVRRTRRPAHGPRSATTSTQRRCSPRARGFSSTSTTVAAPPGPAPGPGPSRGSTVARKRTPSPRAASQVAGSSVSPACRKAPAGTSTVTLAAAGGCR